jgi:hypothetical protein
VLGGLGGSLLFAGGMGPALAYYRAGRPLYATFSGVTRTALLVGGFLADTQLGQGDEEEDDHRPMPIFSMLALGAVGVWAFYDLLSLERRAEAAERGTTFSLAPTAGGATFGLAGTF